MTNSLHPCAAALATLDAARDEASAPAPAALRIAVVAEEVVALVDHYLLRNDLDVATKDDLIDFCDGAGYQDEAQQKHVARDAGLDPDDAAARRGLVRDIIDGAWQRIEVKRINEARSLASRGPVCILRP